MAKTAVTPEPALYCRKCSYDLRGQVEHRCPECGRAYDPTDPKTFRRKPRGRAGWWIKRIGLPLAVLLLLAVAPYAWLYYDWRQEQPAVENMKQLGARVRYKRIDPPVFPRLLPDRFAWMLDRASSVNTLGGQCTDADLILLTRCRRLEALYGLSSVTDRDVQMISEMPDLRRVTLSGSGITDASAAHLSRCRGLSELGLFGTSLTDDGLARLCALPELTTLTVESSRLTDAELPALANLPKLNYLYIDSPRLTDAGLPALASLPKLSGLYIHAPAVDDDGLAILARLSRLQWLSVWADHSTPAGEMRLRQSLPNCTVIFYCTLSARTSSPATAPAD